MSTRMWRPSRSSQGAASSVSRYSSSSEISLLQAMPRGSPGTATLRVSTSAQMISIIASRQRLATTARASMTRPNPASRRARAGFTAQSLRGQRLQLFREVGVRLHRAGPARVVGLVEVRLGSGGVEGDGLDAGLFLARLLVLAEGRPEGIARFECQRLLVEEGLLLGRQLLVGVEVHDDRDLGVVEARVDAVLRLLLPVEVEDAADRPAVAVDDVALERGVDLAGRRRHVVGAERGEE